MRRSGAAAAVILFLLAIGGSAQAPQPKGGGEETGAYDIVPGWPANYCGPGFAIGATGGIWAESPDRVIVFSHRPGRIRSEFAVPLARPRNIDIKSDHRFLEFENIVWKQIEEEVKASREGSPI